MRRKLRVVIASFEAVPFIKTGGLGDVCGSLPKALTKEGCEVRVLLPKLDTIPQEYRNKMTHVTEFNVNLGWRNLYCGIEKLNYDGVTYYFLDNEHYFKRGGIYGYFDDGERMAFFSKAICESLQYLPDFKCDILHCNDWHTSLAPVFLREFYNGIPLYDNVRTIMTVHNLKFQGKMSSDMIDDVLGLGGKPAAVAQLAAGKDTISMLQAGLIYADLISTVSPTYANEVKDAFFGEGMEDIFRRRDGELYGIVNGIDTIAYNPVIDQYIAANFGSDFNADKPKLTKSFLTGKKKNKLALQKELGLEENADKPLIVMISRLTDQKGLDLVSYVFEEILGAELQFAVLGTGEKRYEDMFKYFENRYPGKVSANIKFDEALSHRMYAGADMILMPSLFEPCGLSQIIAMRYATLPIVRETGGLKDTVQAYNQYEKTGNGFSFANYNAHEMMFTLFNALDLYYNNRSDFEKLMLGALMSDYSWSTSAKGYVNMYQRLHPEVTIYK